MKKIIAVSLGLLLQGLGTTDANAIGPFPMPTSPNVYYQTNPTAYMTPNQKAWVKYGFDWAWKAFQQNRLTCQTRAQCLHADLNALQTYVNQYPNHPESTMLKNIHNLIKQDAQQQKFVSQWIVFQSLSPSRQAEYRSGLRITPIQSQSVMAPWGMTSVSKPAFFNQDDVLTQILQQIVHFHKNCNQYVTCLRGDINIIRNVLNRLAPNDPVRGLLSNPNYPSGNSLIERIEGMATSKLFNSFLYLKLYNPLDTSWSDTFRKHKAKKLAGYGYTEWKSVEKSSSPPTRWKYPTVTNGAPITQYQAYQQPYGNQGYFMAQKEKKKENFFGKVIESGDFLRKIWGK